LLGAFSVTPGWTAAGATGVILGAVYMLWMYRRVIFGPLKNPANDKLADLNFREMLLLTPILLLIIVMGVYPQPFLRRIEPAVALTLKNIAVAAKMDRAAGVEFKNHGR
jgi:NADH-quinone oxidoreductase subunit M